MGDSLWGKRRNSIEFTLYDLEKKKAQVVVYVYQSKSRHVDISMI